MPTLMHSTASTPITDIQIGKENQMTTKGLKKTVDKSETSFKDSFFDLKELTFVSHIEALKRIARDDSMLQRPSNNINSKQPSNNSQSALPNLLSVHKNSGSIYSEYLESPPNSITKSQVLKDAGTWATEALSLPGNLRKEGPPKFGNLSLTVEEVLSSGTPSSELNKEEKDETNAIEKAQSKGRRKSSSKSRKKKSGKKKHQSSNHGSMFPRVSKDLSGTSISATDLSGLTACCQGATIHEKNIEPKQKKIHENVKTSSTSNSRKSQSHGPCLASKSLSHAIIEYSKKNPSRSHNSIHKKKADNNLIEDVIQPRKVYLSEKQSGLISDSGLAYPCAPPATPTAEQAKKYDYVPSLHDIRSQRSFRQRLQAMETKVLRKERRVAEDAGKAEALCLRERKAEQKRRQRAEIYALNAVMTELEYGRFKDFMAAQGDNV